MAMVGGGRALGPPLYAGPYSSFSTSMLWFASTTFQIILGQISTPQPLSTWEEALVSSEILQDLYTLNISNGYTRGYEP